jgi:hypothetical protein
MPSIKRLVLIMGTLTLFGSAWSWAGGQALHLQHPVVDWNLSKLSADEASSMTQQLMAMSEEQMLSYVPPFGFCDLCECPNCYGGVEGNNVLQWDPQRPDELVCRYCKTVVFPNERYPETKTRSGENMLGETVSYPYYYNEETKVAHFMSTHLKKYQRNWLLTQIQTAARAYASTGDESYARRVALVLDRCAQVYPHYPVMRNTIRAFEFRPQKMPYNWDSGRWGFFHNEVPIQLIPAYDIIYNSPELEKLSAERGYDVRERVENDFLKAAAAAALQSPYMIGNTIGYDGRSVALLGQVIAEPRYVHWAFGWMVANVNEGFFRDGLWGEGSPSYHYMTVGGLKSCFDVVTGYSDPPGYADPESGRRFDNLDPASEAPMWAKCLRGAEMLNLPNGDSACVHDSWYYEKRGTPREATASRLLPAFGHAILGRGHGTGQMEAHLHFSAAGGHAHNDSLNLLLWAKGKEMLPDLGYTWTQMRYWTACTLGHNLVVVDRLDQAYDRRGGNLLLMYPGDPQHPDGLMISAVEAEAPLAYQNVADLDLYRRLLVTIPVSADDAYVVDVFRVRGGSVHDWTLQGSADEDSTATCNLPLQGKREWMLEEGEEWVEPQTQGERSPAYGFVRDVGRADYPGEMELDIACDGDTERGLKVRLYGEPGEVWLGRSPSVRRMGIGTRGDGRKAYDYWMPKLIVRREGTGPLTSTFAAVHEPWQGKPFVGTVKRLQVTPDDGLCVALEVRHGQMVDTIISTADSDNYTQRVTETGIRLQGRLGAVRTEGSQVVGAWLLEGTYLGGPNWSLQTPQASYEGTVAAIDRKADGAARDALITAAKLPDGDTLQGHWLLVTLPNGHQQGFQIDRVKRAGNETVIELMDDPALQIEGDLVREVNYPKRQMEGECHFRLPGTVSVLRQKNNVYQTAMTAASEITLPR